MLRFLRGNHRKFEKEVILSSELHLLPDEYYLTEGHVKFEISCDKLGAQPGSPENISAKLEAIVYMTNQRVHFQSFLNANSKLVFLPLRSGRKRKQRATFSICLAAIQTQRIEFSYITGIQLLTLVIRKDHGPVESITSPDSVIGAFFPRTFDPALITWKYRECHVFPTALFNSRVDQMSISGGI
jgi:hypothetical protein